jgi:hypothetical protein
VKELVVDDHNDMMKKLMLVLFELNLYFQLNEMVVEHYENLLKFVFDLILVIVVEKLLNDLMIMLKSEIHIVVELLFDKLKPKILN